MSAAILLLMFAIDNNHYSVDVAHNLLIVDSLIM